MPIFTFYVTLKALDVLDDGVRFTRIRSIDDRKIYAGMSESYIIVKCVYLTRRDMCRLRKSLTNFIAPYSGIECLKSRRTMNNNVMFDERT